MKNGVEDFVAESTPVLDLKKGGVNQGANLGETVSSPTWDAERTEVYSDVDDSNVVATLVGEQGEHYPITTFPFVMGRGSECDLVLQGKGVSRRHAEIIFQAGRFVVNDLESLNGMKVNGYKVARVILEENDVVKLGEVSLKFQSGGGASASADSSNQNEKPKSKKGLFGGKLPDRDAAVIEDDTFGPSPIKKIATFSLLLVAAGLVGVAGLQYFQQQAEQGGGRVVEMPSTPVPTLNVPVSPKNTAAPAPQVAQTTPDMSAPSNNRVVQVDDTEVPAPNTNISSVAPPPSIAPPPSVASMAMPPKVSEPEIEPESEPVEPVAAVVKAPVAQKKPAPAPVASKPAPAKIDNTAKARDALSAAQRAYLGGNADAALNSLKTYLNDRNVNQSVKDQVKSSYDKYSSLYSQYQAGQASYARGDKEKAFEQWTRFMENEAAQLSGNKSTYAKSISDRVVSEYVDLGNEAAKKGESHKAYKLWQKALELGDNVAARIAIENANNKGMQLYRQALRLEYVNTNKAKSLWKEVTELLPPGTEYHTKASAKLAWYEKWGS